MERRTTTIAALTLGLALAGCSSPAGLSPVPAGAGANPAAAAPALADAAMRVNGSETPDVKTVAKKSIGAINSVGSFVNTMSDESQSEHAPNRHAGSGICHNGREFYAPDRNGDPNSTETLFFYQPSCSQIARDTVRVYTPTASNAETVKLTVSNYPLGGSTPDSVRTGTAQISNATFGRYGVPIVADGFVREASSTVTVGTRTLDDDAEFVVQPASGNVNAFCSDWAGFNATGIAKLDETFGWAGGILSGGTRTVNADESVTWTGSRNATLYSGPIGGLSITTGTLNSSCPIATPAYTIAGGTVKGTSIGTLSATFLDGWLKSLSASRVSLSGGYSLSMASNAGVWPTNPTFITGQVDRNGKQVAAFNVNAAGDGTLTVTSDGEQYAIAGWIVVR